MSTKILTVNKFNPIIEWVPEDNKINKKIKKYHLNAIAHGPFGKIDGKFHYFDKDNKKIKVGNTLQYGKGQIFVVFYPTDNDNYESNIVMMRTFITNKPNIVIKITRKRYYRC